MFGRNKKHADGNEDIPVDATLEGDIEQVEQAVVDYLKKPDDALGQELLMALEHLDDQTDRSDEYQNSVIGSAAVGYASRGEVLGETDVDPVVDELPATEFKAQVALVRAAKDEIRGPSPSTFAALQSARDALAETRRRGTAAE